MRGYRMICLVMALTIGGLLQSPPLFAGQAATPPMSGHSMPMHGQHKSRVEDALLGGDTLIK